MEIISAKGLSKSYSKIKALSDLTFSVKKGAIFGLLGPNGAGKTTLTSVLTTILNPTSGDAMIAGFDIKKNPREIRAKIGVVFQESVVIEDMTAYNNLDSQAILYKIPKEKRAEQINKLLRLVELYDRKDEDIKKYSGGMKRKLEIARALINEPEILFLDEPSLGLDVNIRRKLWEYLLEMNKKGLTIFLSTHYMEEAQFLCTDVAILNKGRIAVIDNKETLLASVCHDVITIELLSDVKKAASLFKGYKKKIKDNTIKIYVKNASGKIHRIVTLLKDYKILNITLTKPTLEQVFLKYTGEELE